MKFCATIFLAIPSFFLLGQASSEISVKREDLLKTLRLERVEAQTAYFVVALKIEGTTGTPPSPASVASGAQLWIPLVEKGSRELNWGQSRLWDPVSGEFRDFKLVVVVQEGAVAPKMDDFLQKGTVLLDRARLLALFTVVRAPGSHLVLLKASVDVPDHLGKSGIPAGGCFALSLTEDKNLDMAKASLVDAEGKSIHSVRLAFEPQDLKLSPREFGTLNRILLTEDLIKEHFRIRSVDPIPSTDGYHRVVLMATRGIKGQEDTPIFKEGSHLIGRLRIQKKPSAQDVGWLLFDPERVLDPDGLTLNLPPFTGPQIRVPFRSLEFWSLDDQLAFSSVNKGKIADLLTGNDCSQGSGDRWLYSSPLDLNLYAGGAFSNLFRRPEDANKGYFFGEKGLLSLEASQTFTFTTAGRFFLRSDLIAMAHPTSAVKVEGTGDLVKGIREAQGFQAGIGASLGWMGTQHISIDLGVQFTGRNYRFDPEKEGVKTQDTVATQRRLFLRLTQHDPTWRGSFFEFSPITQDPLFRDPTISGNESRRYFRGRAAFRPKPFRATSLYVEGVVNQSKGRRSTLPDETAVYLGFFVDMKNFSFSWPWK